MGRRGRTWLRLAGWAPLLLAAACGAADSDGPTEEGGEGFPVTILMAEHSGSPAGPDNRIRRMLEDYTKTDLDITWVPNSSYSDKLNISLASGNLPMLVKVENPREPVVAAGIRQGLFWELGPYLKDYPNLSQADPDILAKIEAGGKIYGIYRARAEGRMGISYRKDWLDRLGLGVPRTVEDFYQVLKAFTYGDPDGNGRQDTFGLGVSKYEAPWEMMQIWFGVPNKWGPGSDGKLVPAHLTQEYREALKFFRKLYEEKLVNADFPIYDPKRWNDLFVNGKAGVMLDVADTAGRLESAMAKTHPGAEVDIIGAVEGPKGLRSLSTSGYNGMYMVSKSGVKTEQELRKVLQFLDRLNDEEMQKLLGYGLEGTHYTIRDGRLAVFDAKDIPEDDKLNDLGQLLMMIPDRTAELFRPATPLREKVQQVIGNNRGILVRNPAEALESAEYLLKGTMLDDMIKEARLQYITGKTDDRGLDAALAAWRSGGGDRIIREINEAYAAAGGHP